MQEFFFIVFLANFFCFGHFLILSWLNKFKKKKKKNT